MKTTKKIGFSKVISNNSALYVLLPKKFTDENHIEAGEFVRREISGDSISFKLAEGDRDD